MPRLPAQQLVVSGDKRLVVVAQGTELKLVDGASGVRLSSTRDAGLNPAGASHTGVIRLLLLHDPATQAHGQGEQHPPADPENNPAVLISTGEDKLLKTWTVPGLKLLHSRQLIKRATALAVSPDGKNIIIADKFGDVYDLPFDAPSQTVFQSDPDQEEDGPTSDNNTKKGAKEVEGEGAKKTGLKTLAPIAGHVSVVTSLTMVPRGPGGEGGGGLLVTGDRDEHIRVSRYPQGWAVERYLLGHRKFVGALLWLPRPVIANAPVLPDHGRLLSAGGDDALFVWDLHRGSLAKQICIARLAEGLRVSPAKQNWFSKARTNKRRRQNPPGPGKQQQPVVANDGPAEDDKTSLVQDDDDGGGGAAAAAPVIPPPETPGDHPSPPIMQKTCVNKIAYTPPCDLAGPGYVLVTSVGSSTLAYIPLTQIFQDDHSQTSTGARYIDLALPILDVAVLAPSLLLVSLDPSFSPHPSRSPFRLLSVSPDQIQQVDHADGFNLSSFEESTFIESSADNPMPSQETLYPELLLFAKDAPSSVHKPSAYSFTTSGGRSGKKHEGRLVSQSRCERVLAQATATTTTTVTTTTPTTAST